jgi:DNA primase
MSKRVVPGGIQLSVVNIPQGKDPDELIKQDADVWRETIEQPTYAVDWLIQHYTSVLDVTTALGKRELSDVVLRVIHQLPDAVERDHYVGRLAGLLGVSKTALTDKLQTTTQPAAAPRRHPSQTHFAPVKKDIRDKTRTEEHLMALTLMQPSLRPFLYSLEPEMFDNQGMRAVFEFLAEHPDFDGQQPKEVKKIAEYGKILSLVYETLYQSLDLAELHGETARLQELLVRQYVKMQKLAITAQLQTAEAADADRLLRQVRDLDTLLRTKQGGASGAEDR